MSYDNGFRRLPFKTKTMSCSFLCLEQEIKTKHNRALLARVLFIDARLSRARKGGLNVGMDYARAGRLRARRGHGHGFFEYACFPIPSEVVLPAAGAIAAATDKKFCLRFAFMHGGGFFRDVFLLRRGLYRRPAVRSISRRALPARERANRRVIRVLPPPRRFGGGARAGNPFVPDVYRFCRGGVPAKAARYAGFSLIGITLWNAALIGLGYLFADNVAAVGKFVSAYKTVIVYIAILGFYFYFTANDLLKHGSVRFSPEKFNKGTENVLLKKQFTTIFFYGIILEKS